MLPALANKVTPDRVPIPIELSNLFNINWLYGFISSVILYYVLNIAFPDRRSLIPCVIYGDTEISEPVLDASDNNSGNEEGKAEKGLRYSSPIEVTPTSDEKK